MVDYKKREMGKKSRKEGKDFETRVRKDLEEKGWIINRWSNQVDFLNDCLRPSKPKYIFNPKNKELRMVGVPDGFPDFIAFKRFGGLYGIIGVESKINGKLDKEEKMKVKWLLDNKIFSEIKIAKKVKEKNRIKVEYKEV